MLSLDQLRKIDPRLSDKPDAEVEELRSALYGAAQLAFDLWWDGKNGSKNPAGSLIKLKRGCKI